MKDFKEILVKHLKNEELRVDYNLYKEEITSVFQESILRFHAKLTLASAGIINRFMYNNPIRYNFITYNYTNVLDKCIKLIKNDYIEKILHIHGIIQENVIMGIDNVEQIKNPELSNDNKLQRTIIKPVINTKLKNFKDRQALSLIDSSSIICIFGLSLGESDGSWWKKLGQWLNTISGHLIIFDKVDEWNTIHPDEYIERIDNVMERFCSAAGISQEQYTDRIHIGLNTDMFKLKLT